MPYRRARGRRNFRAAPPWPQIWVMQYSHLGEVPGGKVHHFAIPFALGLVRFPKTTAAVAASAGGILMIRSLLCFTLGCLTAFAGDIVKAEFKTDLVPHPVPYAVLLPDGYEDGAPLPLLLFLHGGGGDREALTRIREMFDEQWKSGQLPKMVVATPSVSVRCFYMDYKDGTEKWETMIVGPFREFLQKTYNASSD